MSSPPPCTIPTLPLRSASPHAQQTVSGCTQTRHEAKLAYYGPHLSSLLRQNISYTPVVWSSCGRPHRDTLTVLRSLSKSIARKRNFVSAEVIHQNSTLASPWKSGTRQIRACWPLAALPDSLDHDPLPLSRWCLRFPWPVLFLRRAPVFAPSRFVCPSHVTYELGPSSSDDWLHSSPLLESPSRLVAPVSSVDHAQSVARLRPRSRSRSPLPKAAPGRHRCSILLSQRGPAGLSAHGSSRPLGFHPPPLWLLGLRCWKRSAAGATSASALSEPRAAAAGTQCFCHPAGKSRSPPLAPLRLGVASVTSTAGGRDAPSARCGARFLQAAVFHSCGGLPAWTACFTVETIVKAPEA